MIVCKFGGTSVADADAIDRAVAIVRDRTDRAPIVVVSALGGATNALLDLAKHAAAGDLLVSLQQMQQLRERHLHTASVLLDGSPELDDV